MAETPYRVAIADDCDDIRYMLRRVLELDPAFTVIGEAGTGAEAVALAESQRPDVMMMDLAMPEMDGLEAIRKIRDNDTAAKIVVLSGFEAATMANEALQRGEEVIDLQRKRDRLAGGLTEAGFDEACKVLVDGALIDHHGVCKVSDRELRTVQLFQDLNARVGSERFKGFLI